MAVVKGEWFLVTIIGVDSFTHERVKIPAIFW